MANKKFVHEVDGHPLERTSPLSPLVRSWQVVVAAVVLPGIHLVQDVDTSFFKSLLRGDFSDPIVRYTLLIFVGFFALILIIGGLSLLWSWWYTRFLITPQVVYYYKGRFWRTYREVPVNRIQSVEVWRPFLAQVAGLAILHIESAGGGDSDIQISMLKRNRAEALAKQLRLATHADSRTVSGDDLPVANTISGDFSAEATVPAPSENRQSGNSVPLSSTPAVQTQTVKPVPLVLFKTNMTRLVLGEFTSSKLTRAFISLLIVFMALLLFWLFADKEELFKLLIALGFGLLSMVLVFVQKVIDNWQGKTVLDGKNLQISGGLTNRVTQSTPISRIHGVVAEQSMIWALFGWWNATIAVAGRQGSEENKAKKNKDDSAVRVGHSLDVERLIWATLPDLGTDQPKELIRQGLNGDNGRGNWLRPEPISWIFHPLKWFRAGLMVTDKAVLLRTGFWHRDLTVLPLTHVQHVDFRQGPIQRLLGIGKIVIYGVAHSPVQTLFLSGVSAPQGAVVSQHIYQKVLENLRQLGESALPTQRETGVVL